VRAFGSPGPSSADPTPSSSSDGPRLHRIPTVLWGSNEDTRLLLRGLLKIHHCPSVEEIANLDDLEALPSLTSPTVLIVDVDNPEEPWDRDLALALEARPELRGLVILPRGSSGLESRARAAGACEVIFRPFAIQDFASAVASTADASAAPPGSRGP
jgi:AmiR/NasT family two-component response regulator